eukprot:359318-Chlamydomonas_euryale.AAC.1
MLRHVQQVGEHANSHIARDEHLRAQCPLLRRAAAAEQPAALSCRGGVGVAGESVGARCDVCRRTARARGFGSAVLGHAIFQVRLKPLHPRAERGRRRGAHVRGASAGRARARRGPRRRRMRERLPVCTCRLRRLRDGVQHRQKVVQVEVVAGAARARGRSRCLRRWGRCGRTARRCSEGHVCGRPRGQRRRESPHRGGK